MEFHASTCEGRPLDDDDIQVLEDLGRPSQSRRPGDGRHETDSGRGVPSETVANDDDGPELVDISGSAPHSMQDPVSRTDPSIAGRSSAGGAFRRSSVGVSTLVECPICSEKYPKSVIEEHAALCGDEVYV